MARNERSDDNDGGFNGGSAEIAGSQPFRASIKTVVKDDAPSTEHREAKSSVLDYCQALMLREEMDKR